MNTFDVKSAAVAIAEKRLKAAALAVADCGGTERLIAKAWAHKVACADAGIPSSDAADRIRAAASEADAREATS